jgi:hypothetical protein
VNCRYCGGDGYWMAPVYHNERQRELCPRCAGRGYETPDMPQPPKPSDLVTNVITVDFKRGRRA